MTVSNEFSKDNVCQAQSLARQALGITGTDARRIITEGIDSTEETEYADFDFDFIGITPLS